MNEPAGGIETPMAGFAAGLSMLEGRARRVFAAAAMTAAAYRTGKRWHDRLVAARSYRVTVDGSDDVYRDLQSWLVEQVDSADRRSLHASTSRRAGPASPSAPSEDGPVRGDARSLRLAMDASREQAVRLAGRTVTVQQSLPEWIGQASGVDASRFADLMRVTFTCPDEASRDAVLDLLARLAASQVQQPARLHVVARWGGWTQREFPPRPLDTVVLRPGQAEALSADLGAFLAAEVEYARLGWPWHRGYLLHGPPGTGKTSAARALATEHRLDVYLLPLSAVANDAALFELLAAVPDRSMLLVEDVDIAHASRTRDDGEKGVTMSGLLNALDGVATPHGMVTVLTTNDATVLDPALLRAGRSDVVERFDPLDAAQMVALAERLAGITLDGADPPPGAVAADVVETIKATMGQGGFYRRVALANMRAR